MAPDLEQALIELSPDDQKYLNLSSIAQDLFHSNSENSVFFCWKVIDRDIANEISADDLQDELWQKYESADDVKVDAMNGEDLVSKWSDFIPTETYYIASLTFYKSGIGSEQFEA